MNVQKTIVDYLRSEMLIGDDEEIGPDDPLVSSGIIDSFSMIAILDTLEKELGVKIARNQLKKESFENIRSIETLCNPDKGPDPS